MCRRMDINNCVTSGVTICRRDRCTLTLTVAVAAEDARMNSKGMEEAAAG